MTSYEYTHLPDAWTFEAPIEPWWWTLLPPGQQARAHNQEDTIWLPSGHGGGYVPFRKLGVQPVEGVTLWRARSTETMATRAVEATTVAVRLMGTVRGGTIRLKGYYMLTGAIMFSQSYPADESLWTARVAGSVRASLMARGQANSVTTIALFGRSSEFPLQGQIWNGGRRAPKVPVVRMIGKQDARAPFLPVFKE
jgi:hypothetical protein